jgi:fructose-bisphosphate aldolase, class I
MHQSDVASVTHSRAIQQPALECWKGKPENVKVAQELLYNRMLLNKLAREGEYSGEVEKKYAAVWAKHFPILIDL